ncbi:multidrug resistance efflux protein, EmrA family [Campylobacter blaseri]|uniref:Secretion protein HlyD n=1 Tax=Campylobacter blaseri TaxID=2042961 RepID=A0A2P8R3G9_9BACT|nr:HlyD family efflux transporter periplasmic adaptor subunit [Campylobacter blaseri]PSM53042.1 secretion protein HlyD [Campylobacter blaseri]PSM54509.1 secretion protein HlyD [Campylobacter blaseri]QKF85243.1 multidrug resistance efflux protein, EmrA family [Campylobacter blaseri]
MKKIILFLIVLIIGFCGYELYKFQISKDKNELVFYGNIDIETSNLSFRFLGQIVDIKIDEGDKVKKGEELASLDNSYLLNKLDELNSQIALNEIKLEKLQKGFRVEEIKKAKANLDIANAKLVEAKSSFNRQEKLLKSKATSQDTYTKVKANFEMAKANANLASANYQMLKNGYEKEDIKTQIELINSLKINADKIKLDIQNHTLKSPIDGVVLTKYKEIGEVANPSEPVVEIAKSDDFWVRAYIDEPLLGEIKLGDKMEIFTDLRDKPYNGHISFISSVSEFTPKNVQTQELRADLVYRFKVVFDENDGLLKQGMPVHLKLK